MSYVFFWNEVCVLYFLLACFGLWFACCFFCCSRFALLPCYLYFAHAWQPWADFLSDLMQWADCLTLFALHLRLLVSCPRLKWKNSPEMVSRAHLVGKPNPALSSTIWYLYCTKGHFTRFHAHGNVCISLPLLGDPGFHQVTLGFSRLLQFHAWPWSYPHSLLSFSIHSTIPQSDEEK